MDILISFYNNITIKYLPFILLAGMHPRLLVDGFEIAKKATLQFLEKFKTPVVMGNEPDREILKMVARTTLRTKVYMFVYSDLLIILCIFIMWILKLSL